MASRNRRRKSESSDDTESVATVATGSTSPASSSTAFTKTTAPTNKFETGSEPGGRDIERGLGSDGGKLCTLYVVKRTSVRNSRTVRNRIVHKSS